MSDRPKVDQAACLALHRRLLDGDPVASTEVFELLWEPVLRTVCTKKHVHRDNDELLNAMVKSFGDFIRTPSIYRPDKRTAVLTYLVNSVIQDYKNELHKKWRRARREKNVGTSIDLERVLYGPGDKKDEDF